MKPHRLSELLEVSGATLRVWARDFSIYLSAHAQTDGKRYREFTEQDARIMAQVKLLKRAGLANDHIHSTLRELQAADWRDLPPLPVPPPNIAPVPVMSQEAAIADRRGLLQEIDIYLKRIDQLEHQLATTQSEKEQLMVELAEARLMVRLYLSGQLKPPTPPEA